MKLGLDTPELLSKEFSLNSLSLANKDGVVKTHGIDSIENRFWTGGGYRSIDNCEYAE